MPAPGHPIVLKVAQSGQSSREGWWGVLTCPVGRGAKALAQLHLPLQEGGPLSIPRDGPAPLERSPTRRTRLGC